MDINGHQRTCIGNTLGIHVIFLRRYLGHQKNINGCHASSDDDDDDDDGDDDFDDVDDDDDGFDYVDDDDDGFDDVDDDDDGFDDIDDVDDGLMISMMMMMVLMSIMTASNFSVVVVSRACDATAVLVVGCETRYYLILQLCLTIQYYSANNISAHVCRTHVVNMAGGTMVKI